MIVGTARMYSVLFDLWQSDQQSPSSPGAQPLHSVFPDPMFALISVIDING
jgi:hypothetical protein